MITIRKSQYVSQTTYWLMLDGLSTDTKPTHTFSSTCGIGNGSIFQEIDTGDVYQYDADNHVWYIRPALAADAITDAVNAAILGGTW